MKPRFREIQYSILGVAGLAGLMIGQSTDSPLVRLLGAAFCLGLTAWILSDTIDLPWRLPRLLMGLLLALSLWMLLGSALYYLGTVHAGGLLLLLACCPLLSWIYQRFYGRPTPEAATEHASGPVRALVWFLVELTGLIGFMTMALHAQTTDPSRSPWLLIPLTSLGWLALATLAVYGIARTRHVVWTVIASSLLFLSGVSLALIVFPLGYGFDPFLHQATVNHIAQHGTITPKPFYYIGQYALELLPTVLAGIDAHAIDVWLVPLLAALFLPMLCAMSVWRLTHRRFPAALAALLSLLLPLAPFINTTPQGLATLWSLAVFFTLLPPLVTRASWLPASATALLALTALVIHPLAGLPAALFWLLAVLLQSPLQRSTRHWLVGLISLAGIWMLPLAFLASGATNRLNIHLSGLAHLLPETFFSTRFFLFQDLLAWLGVNAWLGLLLLAGVGAVCLRSFQSRRWLLYPLLAAILLGNALLLSTIADFSFLINYEQTNYVDRVVQLLFMALSPLAVVGGALGLERLYRALPSRTVQLGWTALLLVAICASIHVAYPRHDAYSVSRGFTMGQSDQDTVISIASDARDVPYIVLANQTVSAAAVSLYGFAPYYGEHQDIFYYPIPTGGPLYQLFLEMIEGTPTTELAAQAMDLAGVDRVYFVVNNYWWSAEQATERAKVSTDTWFAVDDAATVVFRYDRSVMNASNP